MSIGRYFLNTRVQACAIRPSPQVRSQFERIMRVVTSGPTTRNAQFE